MTSPVVQTRDLTRDYAFGRERVHALRGVTFDIADGDYAAIVGPSGCGKSTLLNLLGAIDHPTSGSVIIRGTDVANMQDREATSFRLRNIGFVFQRFYLMPTLSARENVELPMAEAGIAKSDRTARARELLEYVALGHRERHRPSELSGGEQQRVAIARALANRPAILLADEPTGELDAGNEQIVLDALTRLRSERGSTVILVTHSDRVAAAVDRVVEMRDGRVVV